MRLILNLVSLAIFALSASSWAAENLVLVGGGKLYSLSEKGIWKEIDSSILDTPEFARPSGASVSPGARVFITDKQVQLDFGGGFVDSGFQPPPGGISYRAAHVDTYGNIAIELGGTGSGFNYKIANGPVILASRMEWSSGSAPQFKQIIANPVGEGLLGIDVQGGLHRITPPNRMRRSFIDEPIVSGTKVQKFHLREGRVFLSTSEGGFGELLDFGNPDGSSVKVKSLKLPVGLKLEENAQVISSQTPQAKGQVENFLLKQQAVLEAKVAPAIVPKTAEVQEKLKTYKPIPERLAGHKPSEAFLSGVERFVSDDLVASYRTGNPPAIFGRTKESADVVDTLVRMKGKNPVLVGEAGVGKTAVAELIGQQLLEDSLPIAPAYQEKLKGALVVETSPARISMLAKSNDPNSQAAAVESFIASLKAAEKELGRPIVLFVDEMHQFSEPQLQALKRSMDSRDGINFLGATTHNELNVMIGRDEAIKRRLQSISVREFSPEETVELLKHSVVPNLEKQYRVKIGDEALKMAVRTSPEFLPSSHRPEGPFKLLQDVAIAKHREAGTAIAQVSDKDVGQFIVKRLGLSLNPYEPNEFLSGVKNLKQTMRSEVIEQERVTDTMVDLWRDINLGSAGKQHRVMLIAGSTGSGKTFSAQTFAKNALGSVERVLEIDGNDYKTGEMALNTLFGAPAGVISSDKTAGVLPDFLEGRGKGANVIIINELDKAHPDFVQAMMEMLDTGKATSRSNGKTYHLGKSLVVFTTNKGDDRIFPRGSANALSREEVQQRLARFSDKDIRGFFMEAPDDNLYDQSKKLPPSVLNRIDRAVPAAPPSRDGALQVARAEAKKAASRFSDQYGFKIEMGDDVIAHLVDSAYVPEDGVRDLKRVAERLTSDSVTAGLEKLKLAKGQTVRISVAPPEKEGGLPRYAFTNPQAGITEYQDAAKKLRGIENPLADPESRKKLVSLNERLSAKVMGQDDAVGMASKALRTKALNSKMPQPATMLLLGSSGTGKTELARAMAEEVYGHPDRIKIFDMGNIKFQGSMQNIFGSPVGFVGSEKVSPFEKFLNDFPEGGVIVFDEIGNVGSKVGSEKDEILKTFYGILDNGKWTSPHGKVYDLGKFTMVFTSNEGEEVFKKLPSDDLRMAAWNEMKASEKTRKMLMGTYQWPEALLNRFKGNITLFKPLVKEERERIAKKFLDQVARSLVEQHGIKGVEADPKLYQALADSFFSHSEGARAMKSAIEGSITDLIGEALIENYDPEKLKSATFHVALEDNFAGKFRQSARKPLEREVTARVTLKMPGARAQTYTRKVTSEAIPKTLATNDAVRRTAYHEAGHAIANDPALTGLDVDHVTIRGESGYGGYARYKPTATASGALSREGVVARLGSILAGGEAEDLMSFGTSSGRSSDLENARHLAIDSVATYGLSDKTLALPLNAEGKVNISHPVVQREVSSLLEEGRAFARKRLTENWPAVRSVTSRLLKSGHIGRQEFLGLVDKARQLKAQGLPERKLLPKAAQGCAELFVRIK